MTARWFSRSFRLIPESRVRAAALRRFLITALAVGLIAGVAAVPAGADALRGAPPEQTSNTFIVRDVRIFDGVTVTGKGSALVVRGRIAAIGRGRLEAPPGIPVYDGRGKTLLPGLIDGHSHPSFFGNTEGDRRDALRLGVTTELDMWGDPALIAEARRQRRSLRRTDRADMWSAGWGVTVPGGLPPEEQPGIPEFPRLGPDADPDGFVADRVQEGSDYIKFMLDDGDVFDQPVPTLTPGQVRTIVAAAHRRGRMAVGHVTELEDAKTAVDAGADGLVHVFLDTVADDELVRAARRRGVFVTPTLTVFDCGLGADDLLADRRVRPYLSAAQHEALNARWDGCPPSWHRFGLDSVRRLHTAGVPITAGTDAGAIFAAHGASMLAELSHLVRAGLSPAQTLTAATATPARHYRLGDRGRIARGFRADLLLINGNPAEDITTVRDIAVIWKNGYPVDRTPR